MFKWMHDQFESGISKIAINENFVTRGVKK